MQVTLILSAVSLAILAVTMYVVVLLIKALRKYIRSEPVRKEKAESARSLGEVLKKRRTACKMTQEFVAETIGVSVCVEGIETPEQFRVLQGMKVKYIQGYYFDRPLERHAFEAKYVK